jgi:hypothetical protein
MTTTTGALNPAQPFLKPAPISQPASPRDGYSVTTAGWTPRWHHVTQLHADGSGWNDCGEASIARYLMECDLASFAGKPQWDLIRRVHDPRDPATIWDLVSQIGQIARGMPDQPGQPPTSVSGMEHALSAYSISWQWVEGPAAFDAAYSAYWSICWVDGTVLAPASFPASFFGGETGYDHLILWLPRYQGSPTWFNDPLTVTPDTRSDVQYDLDAVRQAMGGAWILPPTHHGEDGQARIIQACELKRSPNHLPGDVAALPAGATVELAASVTPHWQQVGYQGKTGWVLRANLRAA